MRLLKTIQQMKKADDFHSDWRFKGKWIKTYFIPDIILVIMESNHYTVLPTKTDSDVMFCLQSYQGLRIDRSLVYLSYPQDMINTHVIYRFVLTQVVCTT